MIIKCYIYLTVFQRCQFRSNTMDNAAAIVEAASKYAKGNAPNIGYGTAGFRCRADILDHVLLRTGVLAALRSKYKHGSMYEVHEHH